MTHLRLLLPLCFVLIVSTSGSSSAEQQSSEERTPQEQQQETTNMIFTKIYGGDFAPLNGYPWYARPTTLNFSKWYGCGGQLVSSQFVLTAAHCTESGFGTWPAGHGYQIGALCSPYTQGNNCGQKVQEINIKKLFVHPNYNNKSWDNDFALLSLQKASKITPVAMDDGTVSKDYPDGYKLWAAGLGSTKLNGGGYPTHLLHVDLGYVKQWRCKALYKPLPWIKDSMMCTTVGAKDTLGGDSGGPLYDKENKVLVGLVSWGMDNPKFPGVYARVSNAYEWITETICENHDLSLSELPEFCATPAPTVSDHPSSTPSISPTDVPSASPSAMPSSLPSAQPSSSPTVSFAPSTSPSISHSPSISSQPSSSPSMTPSLSHSPSDVPSTTPTTSHHPTISSQPSSEPSRNPTALPSSTPSATPSDNPSVSPSSEPSLSHSPSSSPTVTPPVYYQLQSNIKEAVGDTAYCLEPEGLGNMSKIVLKKCDVKFTRTQQMWTFETNGLVRNRRAPLKCMRKVGITLRLVTCNLNIKSNKFSLARENFAVKYIRWGTNPNDYRKVISVPNSIGFEGAQVKVLNNVWVVGQQWILNYAE